ncbi:Histone transcription regulator 3 [Coemansia sp. RSA 1646]|nr:Histone transcription regulator 3 [Coemansia sp. RSA 1646]
MPVFIPVNPPPASEEVGMDAPDNNAPEDMLLRVEEQVRYLIQEYKSALRTWADTRFTEAFNKFDELCKHPLFSQPQEANIERECSAYCNEYGGMDIERLRTSVFMNAGRLYALSNGGPDLYVGLEELERLDLARPRALSALCDESVLRGSLDFFIKALRFGTAEVSHYLAIGQCALLLAQNDIAISMFTQAFCLPQLKCTMSLADAQKDDWILFSKSAGPRQWWCVVAAIQAFLMRGDVELADSIAKHALAVYPDHLCALFRQNKNGEDVEDSRVSAPPVRKIFALPSVSISSEKRPRQIFVVEIHPGQNTISLELLGSGILEFYDRHISEAACSNSSNPFAHVEYRIDQAKPSDTLMHKPQLQKPYELDSVLDANIVCSEPVAVDAKNIDINVADALGAIDKTANIITDNATTSNDKVNPEDNLAASAGDSSNNESSRGVKRQGSLSEDEMPVKRRSTRFSERTTSSLLGGAPGGNGVGQSQGIAGSARIAPARSSSRKAVAISLELQESPALENANCRAAAWLESIGISETGAFMALLEKSAAIANSFAQQQHHNHHSAGRKRSASPVAQTEEETRICSFWCVSDKNSSSPAKNDSTEPSDEYCNTNCAEPRYFNSLKLLFQTQSPSTTDRLSDSLTLSDRYEITVDECCHVLENNCGAIDLLMRYFDKLVEAFYSLPVEFLNSPQLMYIAFKVSITLHEMLLDRTLCMLSITETPENHSLAVRCATFILLVLTNGLIDSTIPNADSICCYIRSDWTRLIGDATNILRLSTDNSHVLQYRFVEAWTLYEASVVSDNIDRARASIAECQKLMEESSRKSSDISVARCSFSGVPVTLPLIFRRSEHLCRFVDLHKAKKLASSGDERAAVLLESIINPFSDSANCVLAFPQTISAIRLLASLHRQTSAAADEAFIIMYELYMYTSQLLEHSTDTSTPLKQVISHCVDCLQRIWQLSDENSSVCRRLSALCSNSSPQLLATQMVALPLGFMSHFCIDPPIDYPPSLTEARYIGLSLWLAAVLTSAQNSICELSAPRALSAGENVESGNISDDDAKVPSDKSSTISSSDNEPLDTRVQFMSALHGLLGERGLCTAADGALLLHLLSTCREQLRVDQRNDACWDVVAACLRCLFDIKLHGSDTKAHSCAHIEMDEQAANLVFSLVEAELLDTLRSRKGTGLRSDLKAIVDKTSSVLGDIDTTKYPRLSMNIDSIDDYLDGPSMPSFTQLEHAFCVNNGITVPTTCLSVTKGVSKDPSVLSAHLTLPFVRAVTQHDLLLSRMRSGLSRAVEEYDNIIEDYKLNVALNPDSSEAWYHLGQAHSDLADELLLVPASEILSNRYDIAILQRSAVSCAVQAKQLLPSLVTSNLTSADSHGTSNDGDGDGDDGNGDDSLQKRIQKLHIRIYSFTACLLYRIASNPLPLLAFQILPSNVLVANDNIDDERQEWDIGIWKPAEQAPYKPCSAGDAVVLFAVASRLDTDNWKWIYMLGKAMAKLNDPLSACACYIKAVYLAIAQSGKYTGSVAGSFSCPVHASASGSGYSIPVPTTSYQIHMSSVPESAMSAIYKLLSTLTKHLYSSSLDVDMVTRFLSSLPFAAANVPDCEQNIMESGDASTTSRRIAVFETIYSLANQVCATDRRRWHHRLVFLLAWIEHNVQGKPDLAKQTLQTVLQTRSSNKLLSSFYKPDFEAPGKHYLYLEKYLGLYIETLVATSDIEGVQIILRKLKRCSGMFFDSSEMQLRIKSAETSTLNKMVHDLNCPRFVIDNLGKEHIVLQKALDEGSVVEEYSVTRHCRLNRTQFNCARDFARDNIAFCISFREHIDNIITTAEKENIESRKAVADDAATPETKDQVDTPLAVIKRTRQVLNQYLDTATRAMALFNVLLDKKKKHFDDAGTLSKLNDNLADLYILILSTYGQERLSILLHPHQSDDTAELASMCSRVMALVSSHLSPKDTGGLFWQHVLFDEANNESSQQYKLLDPLLEFNVNKLLDSVRDARALQPNPFVLNKPRSDVAQVLAQATTQPTTATSVEGELYSPQQPPAN